MSIGRSRRRRSNAGPWLLIAVIASGLLVVVGGLGYLYVQALSKHEVLESDLCPSTGARGQTLVLVDTTDALSSVTQTEVQTWLADLATHIPKGGRFELRALQPGASRTRTIFSLCNPGDGSDLDQITGNPEMALKRWRDGFSGPLAQALQEATIGGKADTSPIMAGIQQLAVDRLASAQAKSAPNTVVVVSDMLENTEYFSHYRQGGDFVSFEASQAATRFATALNGANVQIWLIRRPDAPIDSIPLIAFWTKWIVAAGGQFERARRLQGME